MSRKNSFNIILMFLSIPYFISTLYYLITDYSLAKECDNFNIWWYSLISLMLIGNKSNLIIDDYISLYVYIYCSLVELGLLCWGGTELFNNINFCDNFKESGLYIMGLISFSQQLIIGGFAMLISYTVIILNYMNDY